MPATNGSLVMNTSPGLTSSSKRLITSLTNSCIVKTGSM
jgi:hypothetical protein